MTDTDSGARIETGLPATSPKTSWTADTAALLAIVDRLVSSGNAKEHVDTLRTLLEMREREMQLAGKQAFAQALSEVQARMPRITRDQKIFSKGVLRSTYASQDQIYEAVQPLMTEYGFSFRLSEVNIHEGMRQFVGTLMHSAGHEETVTLFLPLDASPFRTTVQSEGSTLSYARRRLVEAHFNIIEYDADDDGSGQNVQPINEEQLKDLEIKLKDSKANIAKFCEYFNIAAVKDLKEVDLTLAHEMIDRKAAAKP